MEAGDWFVRLRALTSAERHLTAADSDSDSAIVTQLRYIKRFEGYHAIFRRVKED